MSTKKNQIIKLLHEGLPYSQIVEQVGCSKSTVSYHAKNEGLAKPEVCQPNPESKPRTAYKRRYNKSGKAYYHCNWCGKMAKKRRKFCDRDCYLKANEARRLEANWSSSLAVSNFRKRQKAKAVEHKGGKCVLCGYNKCTQALHFHHIDPSTKEFALSSKGITRSWDKVLQELAKCILLCGNCHAEVHAGVSKLPSPDLNEESQVNSLE